MKNNYYPLSLSLAGRYIGALTKKGALGTMLIISFVSIMIGSFSLTLVSAIMNGFEYAMHEKLRGINAPITLHTSEGSLAVEKINALLAQEFPAILATAAHSTHHALIYTDSSETQKPIVAILYGILPADEQRVSTLSNNIITNDKNLISVVTPTTVLIGKAMAQALEKTVGESITLCYSNNVLNKHASVSFDTHDVIIGGIFETGVDDTDGGTIFAHHELMTQLFDEAPLNTLALAVAPHTPEEPLARALEARLGISAYAWQSHYPALVSALALEKYAMFWILALISLVASTTIIALIFMLITQKRHDIALLLSLGMKPRSIKAIFMSIGSCISTVATLSGIIAAWLASLLITHYKLIALPDSYYVSHLPAHMTIAIPLSVMALQTAITLIALFYSTRTLDTISIATALKAE